MPTVQHRRVHTSTRNRLQHNCVVTPICAASVNGDGALVTSAGCQTMRNFVTDELRELLWFASMVFGFSVAGVGLFVALALTLGGIF